MDILGIVFAVPGVLFLRVLVVVLFCKALACLAPSLTGRVWPYH
jgi:hypothetical protein